MWPDFLDFYREVGEPPTPGHRLTGLIPGTNASPGNVRWIPKTQLGSLCLDELTDVESMLFDDETKRLAHQCYAHNPDLPVAKIETLREMETEVTSMQKEDAEQWQLEIEKHSQDYAAALKREAEIKQVDKGRGSQVRVGRAIRRKLVPGLALRLREQHQLGIVQRAGRHHALIKPMLEKLGRDYDLVAHITVTCVLDSIGRGFAMSTPMVKVFQTIGERLDHQAFLEHVKQTDPQNWERIDRWVLQQTQKGYKNKIKGAIALTDGSTYAFLDPDDHVKLGQYCYEGLQSITNWFDTIKWYSGRGKKKGFQYYLGLSEDGLRYRDMIQAAADEASYEAWPMVVPPLRWDRGLRGGYLKAHPGQISRLIHNDRGTIPSKNAMAAIHAAQEVGYKINGWMYEQQVNLLARSEEIGSFRTYEKDSYEDTHKPSIDPAVWDLPRMNDGVHPEIQKAKRKLEEFYSKQKKAEKQTSRVPFRTLKVAARFKDVERFYLPCYFDGRTRIYYSVDTVSPNGADYQKSLLLFADGLKVTDDNREAVKRDLYITLANTWGNKENGVKTDKLTYDGRVEFAENFIKELEVVAKDPLSTAGRVLWTTASEPFQFLACVREIFEVLIWKTKTHTDLPNGRDATNSGMQILGAIIRDEDACYYTNIFDTDSPKDLYGRVAEEALVLLNADPWVHRKIEKYKKDTQRKIKKWQKEGKKIRNLPDVSNFHLSVQSRDAVDRTTLKRSVMCTSYGASWGSKNEYISEELDKAFEADPFNPSLTDKRLITDAAIEGQSIAFPKCDELNEWFRTFGRACMAEGKEFVTWKTPNGSKIVQEYREPICKRVVTHAMGGGSYPKTTTQALEDGRIRYSIQTGWGDVLENKAATALGANWTHSLDACILQRTIARYKNPFYVVHDCFYGRAGEMRAFTRIAREELLTVVTADPMKVLVLSNKVNIETPKPGKADVTRVLNAEYAYC